MAESRYSGRYSRTSRSRSRSPFRKNFNERPNDRDKGPRRKENIRDQQKRNRVFVSNIPFECRWMELKDLFREKVGDVSFVELNEDDKGKFSGTGIVEFHDAESAKKALDIMHKYEFRGRMLNVKEEMDSDRGWDRSRAGSSMGRGMDRDRMRGEMGFNERSGPNFDTFGLNPEFLKSLGIQGPLTAKIFISNLDYKVTEKKLEEIFKLAGKLESMDLSLDNEGKSKGHAIGEYEHPLEAVQAISMFNGQRLYARVMNVRMDRFADDEPTSKLPSGLHGVGKGLGLNGLPMKFNKSGGSASNGSGFGLGIGGLGGGGSMNVGTGSSMGMSSSMSGDRMMSMGMGNSNMSGSSMGISGIGSGSGLMSSGGMSHSMDRDPFQQLSPAASSRGFRGDNSFERDSFNSSAMSDTVLLGNLPSNFTWSMLKDRFRDIGDVRYAEMKGQGNAMLRFGSLQDAQRAVDMMNTTRFEGRLIQARLY